MGHEHHHDYGHHHHHHHGNGDNIKVAFFLNLSFAIIEFIGGFLTNSISILSDALHDLGDSVSLGLAWYFQGVSKKKRDQNFSYGYKRFSLLGALINAIILIVGSIFILTEAIPRLIDPQVVHAKGMMLLALLGIIVNGAAFFKLKSGITINEKMVSLHMLEDVLGWVAVLIGAIIMYFFDWPIVDPILSILIACFILYNVFKSLRYTFKILLQGIPVATNEKEIETYLQSLKGIQGFHDLHIWSMDGDYNILTVHLVVEANLELTALTDLKKKIKHDLLHKSIQHVTIEFETDSEECELIEC